MCGRLSPATETRGHAPLADDISTRGTGGAGPRTSTARPSSRQVTRLAPLGQLFPFEPDPTRRPPDRPEDAVVGIIEGDVRGQSRGSASIVPPDAVRNDRRTRRPATQVRRQRADVRCEVTGACAHNRHVAEAGSVDRCPSCGDVARVGTPIQSTAPGARPRWPEPKQRPAYAGAYHGRRLTRAVVQPYDDVSLHQLAGDGTARSSRDSCRKGCRPAGLAFTVR